MPSPSGATAKYGFPYPLESDIPDVATALQLLAQDVENVIEVGPQSAQGANVLTTQSTTSTSYTDLGTVGPTVTITTGTRAIVILNALGSCSVAGDNFNMAFAVSGATTIAASDSYSMAFAAFLAATNNSQTWIGVISLTAGSNTFTAKYRTASGSTAAFSNRFITVIPLP